MTGRPRQFLRLHEAVDRLCARGLSRDVAEREVRRVIARKLVPLRFPAKPWIPNGPSDDEDWWVNPTIDAAASTMVVPQRVARSGPFRFQHQPAIVELPAVEFDQATAATSAPGAPEKRPRAGPKPKVDWSAVERRAHELMDYHGEFTAEDRVWNAQERLVEKLAGEYTSVDSTTIRKKLPAMLGRWNKRNAA